MLDYTHYGGLPLCVLAADSEMKQQYLIGLYKTIYLSDLKQRHRIKEPEAFDELCEILSSSMALFLIQKII